jgi:hypothetical protein
MTKGLYVQTLANGAVHSVQVEDSTGMQWSLDPHQYTARGHQPPVEELPTLEAYIRNRYLAAVSAAFDDAFTLSPSGTWQVIVESTPKREIVLMPTFVTRNITGGAMQPSDLTKHLQSIPDSAWSTHENGTLVVVLN